jgi:hypothetical protein
MKPLAFALAMLCSVAACSAERHPASTSDTKYVASATLKEANSMRIRLTINGKSTTATLIDSPTTRDFIALLPMTLKLDDYASTEKIAYLPKKLTTQGAPAGIDPDVGDVTYYAPWGNLAIFYQDFGYSSGLIKLGRFDTGVEVIAVGGSLTVSIEAIPR